MCGILALLNHYNIENKFKMNAYLCGKQRGPEMSSFLNNNNNSVFYFHRLAINGLDDESLQPISINNITIICNGEIYNFKELYSTFNIDPITNSDCEVIIHLYTMFGLENTLKILDGVFSFVLLDRRDIHNQKIYVGRDAFGVRPMYMIKSDNNEDIVLGFASEVKVLESLLYDSYFKKKDYSVVHYPPGHYSSYIYDINNDKWMFNIKVKYYTTLDKFNTTINNNYIYDETKKIDEYLFDIYYYLNKAVKKRVQGTTERKVACLLSGGLDSSLIASLVSKYSEDQIETYSIGFEGSEDLKNAKIVSEHIGSKHKEFIISEEEFLRCIPQVIKNVESYDTTTIRASVGNYLIGYYISKLSEAKVIFNGDGSDELTGGYIYFIKSPDSEEFNRECCRLLNDIHYFDVLRSDKSISSNGLEPRTPFLDKIFVEKYLKIPAHIRNPRSLFNRNFKLWKGKSYTSKLPEKLLLRYAFDKYDPDLLPHSVLWRTKEAFSDGVSGDKGSWYEIIQKYTDDMDLSSSKQNSINIPETNEQKYYRNIYDDLYPNSSNCIPYFWMPKYVNAKDSSARSLEMYNNY